MAAGQGRDRGSQVLQHWHDAVIGGLGQRQRLLIETLAQQTQVGADKIDVGDALAQGNGLEALLQAAVPVGDRHHYRQSGMGGIDLAIALLENEGHGMFTLPGEN